MKINTTPLYRKRGMTLLEMTVVILVLLSLISVVFIGARAWKRGSDRAGCIITQRNVQMATRSYQNLYEYSYGGRPYAQNGTQDIVEHLHAKGYIEDNLYRQIHVSKTCAGGGHYQCLVPDVFPEIGQLFLTCSLSASDEHSPKSSEGW